MNKSLHISQNTKRITTIIKVNANGDTIRTNRVTYDIKTKRYFGDLIKENDNKTSRIYNECGYIDIFNGTFHYNFYVRDYIGSTRAVINQYGEIAQMADYYPCGIPTTEYNDLSQNDRLHTGKEFNAFNGYYTYDNAARYLDPIFNRFTTIDPLAEKYPSFSPYTACLNNPLRNIDINGDSVSAQQKEAQQIILNSLRAEDRKHVKFGSNGMIDMNLLSSHKSSSSNFNNLLELASSTINVTISVTNTDISYVDNSGNTQSLEMPYFGPDSDFADPDFMSPNGITTGESGRSGIALLPGKGASGVNSPNSSVNVIINGGLSPVGAAEVYSHEANGHALMFIRTNDRARSGHSFQGMRDTNMPLIKMILNSREETVKNISR